MGEGVVHSPSPEEQLPPSLGPPSQGILLFHLLPGLAEEETTLSCHRLPGGGSNCMSRQDMFDRMCLTDLLLCNQPLPWKDLWVPSRCTTFKDGEGGRATGMVSGSERCHP